MIIQCFLLLRQWLRVKTKDLGHGFWRYYFKICPFQMDLVVHLKPTKGMHLFYYILL